MTETDCDEKTFTLFPPFLLTGPRPGTLLRESSQSLNIMARSPVTASKEGDATSAVEETMQFDDDNLRGEDKYVISHQYYHSQFFCQFEGSL